MKKNRFFVLVDFSDYSDNLVQFCMAVSKIIPARMFFVHQLTGMVPGLADKESKDEIYRAETEKAFSQLKRLTQAIDGREDSFIITRKPILSVLNEFKSDDYFDWVFTGLKGTGALKRILIGSTTLSIIEESNLLTITVPLHTSLHIPHKLMVGVSEKHPINKTQFSHLLASLKGYVNEVEFFTIISEDDSREMAAACLEETKAGYPNINSGTQLYTGEDALDVLKNDIDFEKGTFLVLQQGSRTITDKIFRNFLINELVYEGHLPLIIISQ
jgi:nucleotide-binding universal stress UspA family protein